MPTEGVTDVTDEIVVQALKAIPGGYCLGFADGCTFMVRGCLPGETVVTKPYRRRKKLVFADTSEVIDESEHRIGPWQLRPDKGDICYMDNVAEKSWKCSVLADAFATVGRSVAPVDVSGVTLREIRDGKRMRCELTIGPSGSPSMFEPGTRNLIPISSFELATEEISRHPILTEDWPTPLQAGARVRIIHCDQGVFARIGEDWFDYDGVPISLTEVSYTVAGRSYLVSPDSFWQAGRGAAAELVHTISREPVGSNSSVLELYCGSGLLTQPLTECANHVRAVEGDDTAVAFAAKNAPEAEIVKEAIGSKTRIGKQFNYLVADPPRSGMGRAITEKIIASNIERSVLVFCDPVSAARDVSSLVLGGFKLKQVQILNFFPRTHHFETVFILER